jgi:hypothetical protein
VDLVGHAAEFAGEVSMGHAKSFLLNEVMPIQALGLSSSSNRHVANPLTAQHLGVLPIYCAPSLGGLLTAIDGAPSRSNGFASCRKKGAQFQMLDQISLVSGFIQDAR